MTKRKQQAIALLEQFKEYIVEEQCKADTLKNKKEEKRLYEMWALLDDIQELLIYETDL